MTQEQKETIRQKIEKYLSREDRILPSDYPTLKKYRIELVEKAGLLGFIIEEVQPEVSPEDIDVFLAEVTGTMKVPLEQECTECFGVGSFDVQFNYGVVDYTCEMCEGSGLKDLPTKEEEES